MDEGNEEKYYFAQDFTAAFFLQFTLLSNFNFTKLSS